MPNKEEALYEERNLLLEAISAAVALVATGMYTEPETY